MSCRNCVIGELEIDVMFENDNEERWINQVYHYLNFHYQVKKSNNILSVSEEALRDLHDFCQDHMNPNEVFFRIGDQSWKPITEFEELINAHWIDDVIKNKQVVSYYQPIISSDKKVYAYELLARFVDKEGNIIFPNEIFSAARLRGRLYALDRLCRMTAVKYAARIENAKAFINFIPTSIYSPEHCLKSTTMLAQQLKIKQDTLVFEVVETDQVDDVEHLKSILNYYDSKGFSYALDDVGEGYSTESMLKDLNPRYMKLDMKYVQGVSQCDEKQQQATRLLKVAQDIGSVPLAEGVETNEDFEWLKERGYQLFQGYLFGKPAPEPKMAAI
ncbi:EAL domain-containing protein [Gracilibacillus massiliensis]|uniref:EAL domain-containing protein n=1 Tax=Gracilibacillus massiliensis TaxID=1564956 RepID=UPI00071E0B6E|nr:EAL domain-containing protein [Gracilibacillus massiliensis]